MRARPGPPLRTTPPPPSPRGACAHLLAALGVGRRLPHARAEPLAHQQIERGLVADHDVSRRLNLVLPRLEELEHDGARAHEDETRVVVDVPAAARLVALEVDAVGGREHVDRQPRK